MRYQRLAREICIWATLNHPNVLPLLGYLAEGENMTPSLISEWMLYGTLHEYMKLFPRCGEETCIMVQVRHIFDIDSIQLTGSLSFTGSPWDYHICIRKG